MPLFPDEETGELVPVPELPLQPLELGSQKPNDPEFPLTLVKHAYCSAGTNKVRRFSYSLTFLLAHVSSIIAEAGVACRKVSSEATGDLSKYSQDATLNMSDFNLLFVLIGNQMTDL